MIGTPRREASRSVVIMRGWLVPGLWPMQIDQLAVVEILERHRALADADRFRQADAGGLVAHVRAVGEVVGAVFAREQLVQERGLVRGAARGVELRHVGVGQGAQRRADPAQRLLPRIGRYLSVARS